MGGYTSTDKSIRGIRRRSRRRCKYLLLPLFREVQCCRYPTATVLVYTTFGTSKSVSKLVSENRGGGHTCRSRTPSMTSFAPSLVQLRGGESWGRDRRTHPILYTRNMGWVFSLFSPFSGLRRMRFVRCRISSSPSFSSSSSSSSSSCYPKWLPSSRSRRRSRSRERRAQPTATTGSATSRSRRFLRDFEAEPATSTAADAAAAAGRRCCSARVSAGSRPGPARYHLASLGAAHPRGEGNRREEGVERAP